MKHSSNQTPNIKLSLLYSLPQEPPLGMPTPPRKNAASIPFEWEEAPGKPRPSTMKPNNSMDSTPRKARLDLPPRMMMLINNEAKIMSNLPSPTTVLDGPYHAHAHAHTQGCKSLSFRNISDDKEKVGFRSCRWGSFKDDNEDVSVDEVKISRVRRRGSFFGSTTSTRSSLLAAIYEGFKQVVPWKRRQDKEKKIGHSSSFYHSSR